MKNVQRTSPLAGLEEGFLSNKLLSANYMQSKIARIDVTRKISRPVRVQCQTISFNVS